MATLTRTTRSFLNLFMLLCCQVQSGRHWNVVAFPLKCGGGEGNFMQCGSHIMRPPQTHTMMCLLGGQARSQAWVFCERCVQMRQMLTSLADVATDASDVDFTCRCCNPCKGPCARSVATPRPKRATEGAMVSHPFVFLIFC